MSAHGGLLSDPARSAGDALEVLRAREDGGPRVLIIDARRRALEEAGLRALARECTGSGALHVSRSYSHPFALIATHDEPVGVDIERIASCDLSFARSICTPTEAAELGELKDPDRHLTSIWSGKEALAKGLGDALAYDPRRIDSPSGWPQGRAGIWRACPLDVPAGHVGWLCWRAAAAGVAQSA